jgi:penicillin-binding protein 1A
MFKQIMTVAQKDLPIQNFAKPDGIVGPINVCVDSGKIPTELCYKDPRGPRVRGEYFIKGTEPTSFCDVHVEKQIDVSTGLLATPYCPPELVQTRVFIQRPEPYTVSPKGKIPLDAKYEAPFEYCNIHGPAEAPGNFQPPDLNTWNPGNTQENSQTP